MVMSYRISVRSFNSPFSGEECGFTLLEVMIAVAVIAIALVTLIGAQAQSVSIAAASRFDVTAALLAQWKVADLHTEDYDQVVGSTGHFGAEHPGFTWKTEVDELGESEIGIKGTGDLLKVVDLTILDVQERSRTFTVRTIVMKRPEQKTQEGK